MKSEKDGIVTTTEHYWDCECGENYIHSAYETKCKICGATKDDQPDSRVNEVECYLKNRLAVGGEIVALGTRENDGKIYESEEWPNLWVLILDNGVEIIGPCNPEQPELKCEDECADLIGKKIMKLNHAMDFVFDDGEVFFGEVYNVHLVDREEAIDELSADEFESLDERDLREVLIQGSKGWENMTDDEIAEQWEYIFGTDDWRVVIMNGKGDSAETSLPSEAKEYVLNLVNGIFTSIECEQCPLDCPRINLGDDEAQCYLETALQIIKDNF